MEARQTLTGSVVPKGVQVALAIFAALALASIGAVITKDLGGTRAPAQSVTHPAPGTVLRQDNPVQGANFIAAPVGSHAGRSSGSQIVGNSDLTADGNGPQSDLTRVLP